MASITLSLKHEEEKDLVQACLNKERWAQQQLYKTYYGKMMSVCLRYASDTEEAKDMLHEGFIKVFKNLAKYQLGTSMGAWIRRIMVNTCIDVYRKNARRKTENLDQVYDQKIKEADAVSQFTEKEILAIVQKLSPAYRAVFNLYVIEGYSHREIGEQLGVTESTSRSNLVKARAKLKALLGPKHNL